MIRHISICAAAFLILGCTDTAPPTTDASSDASVSDQIKSLTKRDPIDLTRLEGTTSAEKFLYLIDAGNAVRAGALVGLDGQISAMKLGGNTDVADQLTETRPLFLQAMEESLPDYIESVATIYEAEFTEQELQQLIAIHSDPVMQKMVDRQTDLIAEAVTYAEEWGVQVGTRYEQLISEAADNE